MDFHVSHLIAQWKEHPFRANAGCDESELMNARNKFEGGNGGRGRVQGFSMQRIFRKGFFVLAGGHWQRGSSAGACLRPVT